MEWYWIVAIAVGSVAVLLVLSNIFYKQFFKRFYDIVLSGMVLILISPLFLVLTVVGAIAMHGNPFFVQPRPGKIDPKTGKEKIFKLIKFRTMSNKKDKDGNLLPDSERLNRYGCSLRASSLDELPELVNIMVGDLSICGPRPLLIKYLPLYSEEQRHRHDVRPGFTGYAQAHGRNSLSWEDKFAMDVWYTKNISLKVDVEIILATVKTVLKREGISSETYATMEEFMGTPEGVEAKWEAHA